MTEVERFELNVNNLSHLIYIYSVQLNALVAFFALISLNGAGEMKEFKDHNDMTYYFTDKEDLKQRVVDYLTTKG